MEPWIFYALLSAIFAAAVAIFGKIGIEGVDTTLSTAVRAIVMALFLSGAAILLGKLKLLPSIDTRAFSFILFSGIAGAFSWFFYFLALKTGPVHGVAALDRLSVIFVFVLAVLFLGEPLGWKNALGAALLISGAVLMVWE